MGIKINVVNNSIYLV